ncbi:MAG TPA: hemolysin family protein [Candidatus Baltobacteraceae bacterium]|nr:hemolysin family protein [Candidatus Baltobacteraceae bacterium]
MLALIVSSLIVLLIAAFASGSEAALFTVRLAKVKAMVAAKKPGAKALLRIKENMTYPIGTIVILNNIATIVGSTVEGLIAHEVFHSWGLGAFVAFFTFCVIVFAEIVPKTIGESYAERLAPLVAGPVLFLTDVFRPLLWLIDAVLKKFKPVQDVAAVSEEEIKIMAQMGHESGAIERDESAMIRRVFRLNDITADDMMTTMDRLETIPGEVPLGEQRQRVLDLRHSRVPVMGDAPEQILGVALTRDLIAAVARDEFQATPTDFIQEALRVRNDLAADDLLPIFQKKEQHLAIVEDAEGRIVGAVTLEDVLEELVGEITDEKDIRPETIKRVSKSEIVVDEGTSVSKINNFFNVAIPFEGRIGEYVLERFGRRPKVGETLDEGGLLFVISSMSRTRPKHITVRKRG